MPLLRFRSRLAAHDLPGGGASRWRGECAVRRARVVGVLAFAFGGCGEEDQDRGGELPFPGVVQISPWLAKSGCVQSPYDMSYPVYIDTDPRDGPDLVTVEASLDETVAVALSPGAYSLRLSGGWNDDVPPQPGCENGCQCEGATTFRLDPGEVRNLSLVVVCGFSNRCEE